MAEWSTKTIEQLFCDYCHENGRVALGATDFRKRQIKLVLAKKLVMAFHAMDECENYEDGEVIFAKFINGQL